MRAEYYYVTQQPEQAEIHLLHKKGCAKMPGKNRLTFIGSFYAPLQALTIAKVRFGSQVKACFFCCQSRHDLPGQSGASFSWRP